MIFTPPTAGAASSTNPSWQFDELILALDLYLTWRPKQPPAGHPDLVALSDTLQRLPVHPSDARADDFRNVNSVRRKLGDFTAPDPEYEGKGTKGGEGVHLVWAEFAADPEALAAAVELITASVDALPYRLQTTTRPKPSRAVSCSVSTVSASAIPGSFGSGRPMRSRATAASPVRCAASTSTRGTANSARASWRRTTRCRSQLVPCTSHEPRISRCSVRIATG